MPSLPPFLPRNLQTLATEIEEQRERIQALEAAVAERRLLTMITGVDDLI
jgi:hypothetical protein